MNEKPITANMKAKCNILYRHLKNGCKVTKEQVCTICQVKNERQARDIISTLASRVPIITTSDTKGYRLAMTKEDLEAVSHSWAELSSRIEELQKRMTPLINFREKISG